MKGNNDTLAYGCVAVWVLGLFFLWAYERISEMIYRDNGLIKTITDRLAFGGETERKIFDSYADYRKDVGTESKAWWSLTYCVVYSTSIISAIVLNVGLKSMFDFHWNWLFLTVPFFVVFNIQTTKLMNKFAKIKKQTSEK